MHKESTDKDQSQDYHPAHGQGRQTGKPVYRTEIRIDPGYPGDYHKQIYAQKPVFELSKLALIHCWDLRSTAFAAQGIDAFLNGAQRTDIATKYPSPEDCDYEEYNPQQDAQGKEAQTEIYNVSLQSTKADQGVRADIMDGNHTRDDHFG